MPRVRCRLAPTASPEQIAQRQLELVQAHVLALQKSSPYYRELFAEQAFQAGQLHSVAELHSLPTTSKKQLSLRNREFLAVPDQRVIDICQTSGTTGEPVTIWQTESDLQRLALNEQLAFRAAGIDRGDRVLIGAALDRGFMAGLAYFLGLRRIGAAVIRAGSGPMLLVAELIRRQRPNVLVGVPSLLLGVGRQLQEAGTDPASLGVSKLICIGEPVRRADLKLSRLGRVLQETWEAPVLGTYASTEMATAFTDCTAGCGGHLLPELILVEILDEEGRPLPGGVPGEVVVTPLGIEGTPLLRYRTGDIAALHTEPCVCGRWTPRLGPILGRREQMLKCRGTTLFPPAIAGALHGLAAVQGYYLEVFAEYDLSDRLRVVVGSSDPTLNPERIAELIAAKTRVRPEVVICTPQQLFEKTIRPDQRKPVIFFDYRQPHL